MDNIPNHQVLCIFRVHVSLSFRLTTSGLLVIAKSLEILIDLYPLNHLKSWNRCLLGGLKGNQARILSYHPFRRQNHPLIDASMLSDRWWLEIHTIFQRASPPKSSSRVPLKVPKSSRKSVGGYINLQGSVQKTETMMAHQLLFERIVAVAFLSFFAGKKIDLFNCQTGIKEPNLKNLNVKFLGGKRWDLERIIGEYLGFFWGDGFLDGPVFFSTSPKKHVLRKVKPWFSMRARSSKGGDGDGGWGWNLYLRRFSKSNWREDKKDFFLHSR